jgi:hypothetical protein
MNSVYTMSIYMKNLSEGDSRLHKTRP